MFRRRLLTEDLMDIRLAIGHHHQQSFTATVLHLRHSPIALHPFETLFFFDGFVVPFLAAAYPRSGPALQIQQSQRHTLGGKRHRVMHDQATHRMLLISDGTQTLRMGMRAVIQCRRVLGRQNHIALAYPRFGRRVMGRQNRGPLHFLVS